MFQTYESLPTKIEAVKFTEKKKDMIFNTLSGNFIADSESGRPVLKVNTTHGEIAIIRIGDWIVKDEKIGTYYPVKDRVFRKKYVQSVERDNKKPPVKGHDYQCTQCGTWHRFKDRADLCCR